MSFLNRTAVLTLVSYFVTGISLTLYNKWLMSVHDFGYPLTMILVHMCSNFLLSAFTMKMFLAESINQSVFAPRNMSLWLFVTRFVPVGALFAADIALTNLSFLYVPVSLTEVVKSGIPAGLMLYQACQGDQFMVRAKMGVIFCLCCGIALTSLGEIEFDERGFMAAVGALFTGIARLIMLEKILDETDQSISQPTNKTDGDQKRRLIVSESPRNQSLRSKIVGKLKSTGKKSKQSIKQSSRRSRSMYALVDGELDDDESIDESIEGFDEEDNETSSMVQSTNHSDESINHMKHPNNQSVDQSISSDIIRSESSTNLVTSHSPANQSITQSPKQSIDESINHSVPLDHLDVPHVHQSANHKSRLHPVLSMFYFSPVAALVLTPSFFAFEYRPLFEFDSFRQSLNETMDQSIDGASELSDWPLVDFTANSSIIWQTIGFLSLGAMLAFGLNVSELMTIQHTSALTLCVLSSIKFLMVLALSTVMFSKEVSLINFIGCAVSVCGIASYNYIKWCEINQSQENTQIEHATSHPKDPELELIEMIDEHEESSLFDREDEKDSESINHSINQSINHSDYSDDEPADVVIEYQYRSSHPSINSNSNHQSINRSADDQSADDPELSPMPDNRFSVNQSINQSLNIRKGSAPETRSSHIILQSINQSINHSASVATTPRNHPVPLLSQPPSNANNQSDPV